jgi:hypothetical protein
VFPSPSLTKANGQYGMIIKSVNSAPVTAAFKNFTTIFSNFEQKPPREVLETGVNQSCF